MVSDGIMVSDATMQATAALLYGDNTTCMVK
jgi:hypothetical protein